MAQRDEVLVKYNADITAFDNALDKAATKLRETETVGQNAFAGVAKGAETAGTSVDKFSNKAQQAAPKFNALNNSITQLSRELPAFAVSINTGILAISNNIPALQDAIVNIRKANEELRAQGKPTESVFKQLASSVLSVNTAISVGVTLLTVFGGRIVDFITGSKDAAKSQEQLAKETEDANKKLKEQLDLINKINPERVKEFENLQKTNRAREGGINQLQRELKVLIAKGTSERDIFNKQQQIRQLELLELKQIVVSLELYGDERLAIGQKIADKENEIVAESIKFEREQAKKAAEEAKKRQDEQDKIADRKYKHSQDDAKRLQLLADIEEEVEKARIKRQSDLQRNTLNDLGKRQDEAAKRESNRLSQLLDSDRLSYQQRYDLLSEQLEKGFITQQEYENANDQLNKQRVASYYDAANSIASILGSLAQIVGTQSEEGKALAIAETIISTFVAAQRAYTAFSAFPPAAIAAAAAAVTAGFARVYAIQAVNVPKPTAPQPISPPTAASTYASNDNGGRRFKDGVVNLDGPGTTTSDSIPVMLSRRESVIKASSSIQKEDELRALNNSVIDYEALIQKKYISPALAKERERNASFADNISNAIAYNFNDKKIVKAIEKNRPATSKDIANLSKQIAKQNRLITFENKLNGK